MAKSTQADVLTRGKKTFFLYLWGLLFALRYRTYILTGEVYVHLCFLPLKNASYFSPGRRERGNIMAGEGF